MMMTTPATKQAKAASADVPGDVATPPCPCAALDEADMAALLARNDLVVEEVDLFRGLLRWWRQRVTCITEPPPVAERRSKRRRVGTAASGGRDDGATATPPTLPHSLARLIHYPVVTSGELALVAVPASVTLPCTLYTVREPGRQAAGGRNRAVLLHAWLAARPAVFVCGHGGPARGRQAGAAGAWSGSSRRCGERSEWVVLVV